MKHFLAVLKGCYAVSRMLCLLFALVSVALTILTFTINPTRFDESITEPIFAGLPLAGTAVTILYSGSILVIMLCGHTHNARNDICVDLFGTLLNWIPSFMLMGLIGDFEMWYDLDWQKEIAMEAAVAFMGLFLGLAHFVFCCVSCTESRGHRRAEEAGRARARRAVASGAVTGEDGLPQYS